MRIVVVLLGLAAIVAGCVSTGQTSPEPSAAPSGAASPGPSVMPTPMPIPSPASPSGTVTRPSPSPSWLDVAAATWSGGPSRDEILSQLRDVLTLFRLGTEVEHPRASMGPTEDEYAVAARTVHALCVNHGCIEMALLACMGPEFYTGGAFGGPFDSVAASCARLVAPVPLTEVWPAGALVTTIVRDVRVRSLPEVTAASIKHEPLLPVGTPLVVLDGPVPGSGYWWYRVEVQSGGALELRRGVREGWVAAADHDGTPWIWVASPSWPTVTGSGVTMTGVVDHPDGKLRGPTTTITLTGLAPGEPIALDATGDYEVMWICGVAPEPCGELGCGPTDWKESTGSVSFDLDAVADDGGTATIGFEFRVPAPTDACPSDAAAPWGTQRERWVLTISDPVHGLRLESVPIEFGNTF